MEATMSSAKSVILFSIDGMRPDGLQQAATPNIDRLIDTGAHTLMATAITPPITLPSHTSMFRGVPPERHGITANRWSPMARPIPSIFEVVHAAGRKTASFYNWEELRDLSGPGALDYSFYRSLHNTTDIGHDMEIAEAAVAVLSREQLAFTFVYLGWTDEVGHKHGWMSPEYITAIGEADAAVGRVLEALDRTGQRDQTVCVLQSDHGGHGFTHSGEPEDMVIPWIVSGPGIKRGHTIESPVSIVDTAPTIAYLMDLQIPDVWTGWPVMEA